MHVEVGDGGGGGGVGVDSSHGLERQQSTEREYIQFWKLAVSPYTKQRQQRVTGYTHIL